MAGWVAGKVTLATGGGSGTGRALALTFAREKEEVVADVAVGSGEKTVSLIEQSGGEVTLLKADVSKAAEVEALIVRVIATYGGRIVHLITRRSFTVTSNEALHYLPVLASCASQPNDPFLGNIQVA